MQSLKIPFDIYVCRILERIYDDDEGTKKRMNVVRLYQIIFMRIYVCMFAYITKKKLLLALRGLGFHQHIKW